MIELGASGTIVAGARNVQDIVYTVPAGRRCQIYYVFAGLVVTTALTAAADIQINVTPSGGASQPAQQGHFETGAAVNTHVELVGTGPVLKAGDLIEGRDLSAGGTGTYRFALAIYGVEYDV